MPNIRILAVYAHDTLSIVRRVKAPYSVLSERGHNVSFMQRSVLDPEIAYTYDLVILPNFVPDEALIERMRVVVGQGGRFIYDLSDPLLLKDEQVQQVLALCIAIFVPTNFLAQEVSTLLRGRADFLQQSGGRQSAKVSVIPSVVQRGYFFRGRDRDELARFRQVAHIKEGDIVIGALGRDHDWELLRQPLARIVAGYTKGIHISCTSESFPVLWEEESLRPFLLNADLGIDNYPYLLNLCTFGLCPRIREDGRDPVWAYEYGILGKPVIASARSYSRVFDRESARLIEGESVDLWTKAMHEFIASPTLVSHTGMLAYARANHLRTTEAADRFLKAISDNLPKVSLVR